MLTASALRRRLPGALVPSLAGSRHVRISRDGGRTYPARHVRPLPADPPGQPCTVPVFDLGTGTGRMLALDLDPGRPGDVDHQAAGLGQLLERLGVRYVAEVSPSGGRHVYVLFSASLPWRELRDVGRAFSQRLPAVDPAPMYSHGGQISPLWARHKGGGWRVLSTPLQDARLGADYFGPCVAAGRLHCAGGQRERGTRVSLIISRTKRSAEASPPVRADLAGSSISSSDWR